MASTADRIKELLGNGLSNEITATAVGVDPSYVSQLMSDPVFSEEVISKRIQTLSSATVRDRSWDGIEDSLLQSLAQKIEQNLIYKPMDILRALAVVNSAKRRGATSQEAMVTHKTVVTLNLPTIVVNSYKKSAQGEVIEVETADGNKQTLVTMTAAALMKQLSDRNASEVGKENTLVEYDKIRRYLPSSGESQKSEG
jgi:hypothetical protein